ncbi:MAG: avidin/streptavidin family protein [Candidatus Nitrosoglobus sp.]
MRIIRIIFVMALSLLGVSGALTLFGSDVALALNTQQQAVSSLSTWTNQSGSTLHIKSIDSKGQITGYYINRAKDYGCQDTPYPVTGWVYETAITFTVKWKNATESCNSITSWTGFYYQGVITTLWQLVPDGAKSTGEIKQGGDIFKRVG